MRARDILLAMVLETWARIRTPRTEWEYGSCWTDCPGFPGDKHMNTARRHRKTGEVQFRLWHERAQDDDSAWVNYNAYWWPNFKPEAR